jgi:hypothetical protein
MIITQTKTASINAHHAHFLKTLQEVEHSWLFPVLTLCWPFYGKFPTAFMALSRHFLEAFPYFPKCFEVLLLFLSTALCPGVDEPKRSSPRAWHGSPQKHDGMINRLHGHLVSLFGGNVVFYGQADNLTSLCMTRGFPHL